MDTGQKGKLFVEIIGAAGAGKSTLFRALGKTDLSIQCETLPPVWKFSYIPFFIKNILTLIPLLFRLHGKGDRKLTRRELAWMAMLNGWPTILRREAHNDGSVSLFDQGPIFLITILLGFGPTSLRNPSLQSWWEQIYRQWMDVLDIVIWLDTSDEILINRIRNRDEDHIMKEKSNNELVDFLKVFRSLYEEVILKITVNNPKTRVIRIDTGFYSVDDIVMMLMSEIDPLKSEA